MLFAVTVLTRLPFTSKLLFHLDSVNYALALTHYNVYLHQPHPPGYFLYIMLGKAVYFFDRDENTSLIVLSILFSTLTVITLYFLGTSLFSRTIGVLTAALAITSPTIWLHGEVALSYIAESFFSTLAAYFCWQALAGHRRSSRYAAITLAVACGIRQDTLIFLLPLWLYSSRKASLREILNDIFLMGIICSLWFFPMIYSTGGWDSYIGAFRDLWQNNTGTFNIFNHGWAAFELYSRTVARFTFYGIGAGTFCLALAGYSILRGNSLHTLDRQKILFLSLWAAPSVLFYLTIFIHPANPGYSLIYLPALLLLVAKSTEHLGQLCVSRHRRNSAVVIASIVIMCNAAIFLFSTLPVSYRFIRKQDSDTLHLIKTLQHYDPDTTVVFSHAFVFNGFRHLMYYLPRYHIYTLEEAVLPHRGTKDIFWGFNRQTFRTDEIRLPPRAKYFVLPLFMPYEEKIVSGIHDITIMDTPGDQPVAQGSIAALRRAYPSLRMIKMGPGN